MKEQLKEQVSGSQALVHTLKLQSVSNLFGLIGSDLISVFDELRGTPEIRTIQARHEASAANMANGYARITGKFAVCLVHNGPGLTNALTGLAVAYRSFSPLILISGAATTLQRYRDAIQELDQLSLTRPITKWSGSVTKLERIPEMLNLAIKIATEARTGPVHLDIPRDLLVQKGEVEVQATPARTQQRTVVSDPSIIVSVASLLSSAQRPIIIAGGGVVASDATDELTELSEMLTIPVATSYGHLDAFPSDHPLMLGGLGRDGSKVARKFVKESDVILALGTRLSAFTTFFSHEYISREARIIQVELEAGEVGRHFPVEIGIIADAKAFTQSLLQYLKETTKNKFIPNSTRFKHVSEAKITYQAELSESYSFDAFPIKPQAVFKVLNDVLKHDDIVVLDDGNAVAYAYHLLKFNKPRTFLSPLDLACIGSAYPTALGAKIARPKNQVFAVCGDGGFSMTISELATAVQYGIDVKAIVLNNNCWAAEKAYQKYQYGGRYFGCDLQNPSFAEVAEKFGVTGVRVEKSSDLKPALTSLLDLEKPSLLEVMVDPDELLPPARADLTGKNL